jgi:hypothetical protein
VKSFLVHGVGKTTSGTWVYFNSPSHDPEKYCSCFPIFQLKNYLTGLFLFSLQLQIFYFHLKIRRIAGNTLSAEQGVSVNLIISFVNTVMISITPSLNLVAEINTNNRAVNS